MTQAERPIKFGPFWKRRIRRLYPPYLIALALFFGMAALTTGINVTHFFVYDVVMHLLMLHNLDPHTCYSINGVFWTLAIEEQLYLAYFLLLYLHKRWRWGPTLVICALARIGWFFFGHGLWLATGVIMQSWKFSVQGLPPILNTLLITVPATVGFAWVFYRFCELPYMKKAIKKLDRTEERRGEELTPVFGQRLPAVADEA